MTFQRDLAWQLIELTNRSSVAHQCARYGLAVNWDLLPDDVRHQAKRCVLDALGCAIGSFHAPVRKYVEDTVKESGGTPEATCFGSGLRTSALNASLVNASLVRFLDFSDCGGGGHNSDCLSSILATAEREKKGGKDFMTALVISYELGDRFREALVEDIESKGWTSDIRAGLNMPPALGKLLGLNEDQIANAIGVSLSHALPLGILDSHRNENVNAKNLRFGWAAHDALLACLLAKKGFTGPLRIMESESSGINKVIANGCMDFERLVDFSGWRIMKTKFKAMAANATTHGHIMATLGIVIEQNLKPEDIAAVHIKAPVREALHTVTPAKKYPRNAESGDHSAFYGNAHAIKYRSFRAESSKPERFTDPVILDLIEKMTVEADPKLGRYAGASEVVTKDGRKFFKQVDVPEGMEPGSLSDKALEAKFSEMARDYFKDDHIKKIFDACWNLDKMGNVADLTKLMVLPGK